MTLNDFSEWMQQNELAESTIRSYEMAARTYLDKYDELTSQNVYEFKNDLIKSGASPSTINLRMAGLRKYAEYLGSDVTVKCVSVQKKTTIDNVISDEDYKRLLAMLEHDGDMEGYYRIRFLAGTGARISELVQFKKKHLLDREMTISTKGKIRTIYIPESLVNASCEYFSDLENESYLFQAYAGKCGHRNTGKPIRRETITGQMQRWAEKYEIPKEVMHPHSLRHRFAINFLKRSSNLTLLADLMGHSNVSTTMIYTRMSKEEQREAIDKVVNW